MSGKAILWARVSTDEQDATNQLPELQAMAERRGLTVVDTIRLSASAWTGQPHIDAVDDLVKRGHRGEFDTLIVVALDRLTRRGVEDTILTLYRLRMVGVQVLSVRDDWTSGPPEFQMAIVSLLATLANIVSVNRSGHTKAGMKKAKERGVAIGRPEVVDGVDRELVMSLRAQKVSWAKIHAQHPATVRDAETGKMRPPSTSTIRRAVENAAG